jgi:hypothetical protein
MILIYNQKKITRNKYDWKYNKNPLWPNVGKQSYDGYKIKAHKTEYSPLGMRFVFQWLRV